MSQKKTEIMKPESFCQIGVVVKNIDETIKYYEKAFGFGPLRFGMLTIPQPPITARSQDTAARGPSST